MTGRTFSLLSALAGSPQGYSTSTLASVCAADVQPWQHALTRCANLLRAQEDHGRVRRAGTVPASYHNTPVILWQITAAGQRHLKSSRAWHLVSHGTQEGYRDGCRCDECGFAEYLYALTDRACQKAAEGAPLTAEEQEALESELAYRERRQFWQAVPGGAVTEVIIPRSLACLIHAYARWASPSMASGNGKAH